MKRASMLIAVLLTFGQVLTAREYEVYGPQGGLAMEVTLPKDFDPPHAEVSDGDPYAWDILQQ